MSEEQEEQQEQTIDLDALQKNIDESQNEEVDENLDADQEVITEDDLVNEPEFNLDEALDSFAPISLDGKITHEEAEEKAAERGWRKEGKDKFGHQISAIEFLERTPLFHKMDLMRGDIEKQNNQIKKLAEQSKKIAQKSIEDKAKLVAELKESKEKLMSSELLDSDDIKELKSIDKQIEDNSTVEAADGDQDVINAYDDAKDNFVKGNEWYNSNRAMTTLADTLGKEYAEDYYKENKTLPDPQDLFNYVLDEVKKDFPDMGKPKRQTRVASNRNRTVANNKAPKKTLSDLPEDQQAIARLVMESAELSEEEYLKSYEA